MRKKLNLLAFFAGTVLADLEGVYFISAAYQACAEFSGAQFTVCAAEYPSHFLLHSFLGAVVIGSFVFLGFRVLSRRMKYFGAPGKTVFVSAVAGVLAHLFTDLFFHKGADALALFYPLGWHYSLAFLNLQWFWNIFAIFGFALFAFYIWKNKENLWEK